MQVENKRPICWASNRLQSGLQKRKALKFIFFFTRTQFWQTAKDLKYSDTFKICQSKNLFLKADFVATEKIVLLIKRPRF